MHGSCSSGYGSQDSSPECSAECSIHAAQWQPTGRVLCRGKLVDKAVGCRSLDLDEGAVLATDEEADDDDDEPIYHRLELSSTSTAPRSERWLMPPLEYGDYDDDDDGDNDCASSAESSSRCESPLPYSSSANDSRCASIECASIEYVDILDDTATAAAATTTMAGGYVEFARRRYDAPPLSTTFDEDAELDASGYARVRRCLPLPPPPLPPPRFHAPPPPPPLPLAAPVGARAAAAHPLFTSGRPA